jgi:hypothetical protein
MNRRLSVALTALLAWPVLAHAQPQKPAEECTVKSRSDAVVLLLCPPQADAELWRMAGEAACSTRAACNAWIWDDATKVPDKAPATDAELPKQRTAAAVAVWVNDSKSLMTLKRNRARK